MAAPQKIFSFIMLFQLVITSNPDAISIPFQIIAKLIIIKAEIDGLEGYFIVDTGTPDLTLSNRFFDGFPIDEVFFGINGTASKVSGKYVRLDLGGLVKKQMFAKITDFTALEIQTGLPLFGNIGCNIFRNCEVVFDYIFKELTIYQLDKQGNRKAFSILHQTPIDTLPFKLKGYIPYIEATIGEESFKFALDSGASVNLLNERSRGKVKGHLNQIQEKTLASFGKGVKKVTSAQVENVTIGNQSCKPMLTFIISLDLINKALDGPNLDGIVGYEFLSRFRTSFNFKKKEIYLWDEETVHHQWLTMNDVPINNNVKTILNQGKEKFWR